MVWIKIPQMQFHSRRQTCLLHWTLPCKECVMCVVGYMPRRPFVLHKLSQNKKWERKINIKLTTSQHSSHQSYFWGISCMSWVRWLLSVSVRLWGYFVFAQGCVWWVVYRMYVVTPKMQKEKKKQNDCCNLAWIKYRFGFISNKTNINKILWRSFFKQIIDCEWTPHTR